MTRPRLSAIETRMLQTMRNILAAGISDKEAMIDTASEVIGGGADARKAACRVYDKYFETYAGG